MLLYSNAHVGPDALVPAKPADTAELRSGGG
jgi:hypothetical protein